MLAREDRAPISWHARPRRSGRCYAIGCFGCFVDEFRAAPLERLREILEARDAARAAGFIYGAAWRDANYSRALDRVARERLGAPE